MTRLWQSGFELGNASLEVSATTGNVVASAVQARSGDYSLRAGGSAGFAYRQATPLTHLASGFALRHAGAYSGHSPYLLALATAGLPVLSLWWDEATAQIKLSAGDRSAAVLASAAIGALATPAAWQHVGVEVKLDAAGWVDLYVEGRPLLSYSGNTTGGGASCTEIWYGSGGSEDDGARWAAYPWWDDVYLDDISGSDLRLPPANRCFTYLPLFGNGASAQWSGSDGNSADNYQLVDERPPDQDASYVRVTSSVTALADSYALTSPALDPLDTIQALIPCAVARHSDLAAQLRLSVRLAGVTSLGEAGFAPASAYTLYWARHTATPAGQVWTEDRIADAEIGIVSEPWPV